VGGYVYVKLPSHPRATKQGFVAEHRLLWELANGRLLEAKEVVHHRNGVKTDNRIENLEAMPLSVHRSLHMRNVSDEQRRNISNASKRAIAEGRKPSPALIWLGRRHSPESVLKMSEARRMFHERKRALHSLKP
jgi:hypothetical protein